MTIFKRFQYAEAVRRWQIFPSGYNHTSSLLYRKGADYTDMPQ